MKTFIIKTHIIIFSIVLFGCNLSDETLMDSVKFCVFIVIPVRTFIIRPLTYALHNIIMNKNGN